MSLIKKKKYVTGVGIGYKNEDPKQGLSFIFAVEDKKPKAVLLKKDILPKRFFGIKTDVVKVGKVQELSAWRAKHRPMKLGASCCWEGLTACSAGLPLWDQDGTKYLMMNGHCVNALGSKPGDAILNPSPFDGGKKKDKIGEVTDFFFPVHSTNEHNIDLSLPTLTVDMSLEDVAGIKYTKKVVPLDTSHLLKHITGGGRTIGEVRTGVVIAIDFLAGVWGVENGRNVVRFFKDSILALNSDTNGKPIVDGGDSSSIRYIDGMPLAQTYAGSTVAAIFNQTYRSIKWLEDTYGLKLSLTPPEAKLEGYIAAEGRWSDSNVVTAGGLRLREEPGLTKILKTLAMGDEIRLLDEKPVWKQGYYWIKVEV